MDMKEIVEVWYDFLIGDGNDSQGDEILDVSLRRRWIIALIIYITP